MVEFEELPQEGTEGLRQRGTGGETSDNFIDLTSAQDGKLRKKILEEGKGEPIGKHKAVKVHYTGSFPDGKVFDSSKNRGPLEFNVGMNQVILGWDLGIASMKVGEKAILICDPDFAYGRSGAGGVIPPNATLHFEVELLDANEASSSGIGMVLALLLMLFVLAILFATMLHDPDEFFRRFPFN
ncbi:Peptidyl-prolyl cis-trans isomerase [Hondaea fermentalgiana]|uniref:peptidylprolyl isomerase n=1 Tax=Hondaea fermentalgiana TaxID=2315210 RepID=A0A2R5GV36_9STRA|nr:Peptidyl-prolyl cis-trans isomerase [Hondaea fermentalgiana]|eukprot:GBG34707.1 Peptidyl-prolyl cis-trans isomerase [Hondaea fermentalgiana]